MVEPSNAERSEWLDATRAYVEALEDRDNRNERLAERLMNMAAKRSTETSFGWTHPDCETLQAAASTLRGAPEHDVQRVPIGVLSRWNVELRGTITRDIKMDVIEAWSMSAAMLDAERLHPTYHAKSATEIRE